MSRAMSGRRFLTEMAQMRRTFGTRCADSRATPRSPRPGEKTPGAGGAAATTLPFLGAIVTDVGTANTEDPNTNKAHHGLARIY
jgi:hypothetical protein